MSYKLSKIDMFFITAVVLLGIFCIAFLIFLSISDMTEQRQIKEAEARCASIGGKLGHLKCYKDGKEI